MNTFTLKQALIASVLKNELTVVCTTPATNDIWVNPSLTRLARVHDLPAPDLYIPSEKLTKIVNLMVLASGVPVSGCVCNVKRTMAGMEVENYTSSDSSTSYAVAHYVMGVLTKRYLSPVAGELLSDDLRHIFDYMRERFMTDDITAYCYLVAAALVDATRTGLLSLQHQEEVNLSEEEL